MTKTAPELDTASAVLDAVRSDRAVADAAEARILQAAAQWAAMHSADSIDDAACDWFGDQPIPVAGPGAPLVAEFSIAELASALGLPTEVGKAYVGEALELRHRLPRIWARVVAGDLAAWRARRIARSTIALSREAAAYVDAKVAGFAHKIRPTALDRVIEAAIARFMPEEAEARQQASADGRHLDIDTRQTGLSGTATVYGTLDLADALDLEAAVADVAGQLKELGSEESLDVRRSVALGEIARRQLSLDLTGGGPSVEDVAQQPSRPVVSAGSRTSTSRSSSSRSAPGAANRPDSPSSRSSTSPTARPSTPTTSPTARPSRSISGIGTASSPGAAAPRSGATTTTSSPIPTARPAPATSRPSPVPKAPPAQDPRSLALRRPRSRHLPVDLAPRLPLPRRPHRHRRRLDRPPLRHRARAIDTPPHTPPFGGVTGMSGQAPARSVAAIVAEPTTRVPA